MSGATRLACTAVVLLGALRPQPVAAWGDMGHRIICEIAYQELDRPARDEVKRLMRHDSQFATFSEACIWPDHPRQRAAEHFLNVPRTATAFVDDRCPQAPQCLFTAIRQDMQVLSSSDSPPRRLEALKFLGHWVGDIHQPLHVSYADDKGGNDIDAEGVCSEDTLHVVWDICLVEDGLGRDVSAIVEQLRSELTDADRAQWTQSTMVDWANESYAVARTAEVHYCIQKADACWYTPDEEAYHETEPRRMFTVDQEYMESELPAVKLRLQKAGVRLGHLLNDLLGSQDR
jgi:nuclease S1